MINYNRGCHPNYATYTVTNGSTINVSIEENTTGNPRIGYAAIPLEDLTDGKYYFSFKDPIYTETNRFPRVYVSGYVSIGQIGVGIGFDYTEPVTCGFFDFSQWNKSNSQYYQSGGYAVEIHTSAGNYVPAESVSLSELMLCKVENENQPVYYEPYYIEQNTTFSNPGDCTLTAMWSQNNILTGGALQTQSDLSNWSVEYGTSYTPEIVTYDGLSCFKLDLRLNTIRMLVQSIKGKYELGKYSITAKVNVVNAVAGILDPNDIYNTDPDLMLYFPGRYGSNNTWMAIFDSYSLRKHNNKGWVDIRFTSEAHFMDSGVSISDVTYADAIIYCRNFSGTLYIRDFTIAKM